MNFREAWANGEIEAGTLLDEIDKLLQNQWSQIETVLKDGTEILIFGDGEFSVAAWNGSEWRDIGDIGWGGMGGANPTHWKPLVPPNALANAPASAGDLVSEHFWRKTWTLLKSYAKSTP